MVIDVTLLVVLDEHVGGDTLRADVLVPALVFIDDGFALHGHFPREAVEQMADKNRLSCSCGPLDDDELAELPVFESLLGRLPHQGRSGCGENPLLCSALLRGEPMEGGRLEQRGIPDDAL